MNPNKLKISDVVNITFDDVVSCAPYIGVLEQQKVSLITAAYLWYLGKYIPHFYKTERIDLIHYIIGCKTQVEEEQDAESLWGLKFPCLTVSEGIKLLIKYSNNGLSEYIKAIKEVKVEIGNLSFKSIKWPVNEICTSDIEVIETMAKVFSRDPDNKLPEILAKKDDQGGVPASSNQLAENVALTDLENKLILENENLREIFEKNEELKKYIKEQEETLEKSQKELKVKLKEIDEGKSIIDKRTSEVRMSVEGQELTQGNYKLLYDELIKTANSMSEELGAEKNQSLKLANLFETCQLELEDTRLALQDHSRRVGKDNHLYKALMGEIKEINKFFPDHVNCVESGSLVEKIMELGGPLGPFVGRDVEEPAERAAVIITMWNNYLIKEIAKTSFYDSSLPILKDAKSINDIIKETVASTVNKIGITTKVSEKLESIADYLNTEKIIRQSNSTKESTLSEASKPEASSEAESVLQVTNQVEPSTSKPKSKFLGNKTSVFTRSDGEPIYL